MVIDTLQLDIVVNTKNSGASITTVRNSLEKLYKTLEKAQNQDLTKINDDLAKLTGRLVPLTSALNGLNAADKNLTKLGASFRTFNKRMSEIDAKAMSRKFDLMTKAITPFIDKISSAQEALNSLNGVMSGAKTITKSSNTKTPKAKTPKGKTPKGKNERTDKFFENVNFGAIISKLYFVRNITKQLGQDLAKVIQYGIDYEETLNLWQTSMRGNISQARQFTNEMTRAYGISSATLMNYQATFNNMLSALGNISETTAYGLSEALTQMALDFSSLYNVSVESAMTKFQAVLSGQVRPIRTAGYDITEQTLFQLYQSIGGTKTVRQLNQTEKQLLRILAVYEQMERSGATGDLKKTLYSSANQLRMMGEQAKEFATWIGVGFNTLMEKSGILIDINSALYVATVLAKSFAYSLGYVETDWGIEFAEGVEDANKEVDALKGKLLGFDKFQVLQSGVSTDDGTDVTQSLLDAIKNYQNIYEGVENPAIANAIKFLETLGGKLVDVKNKSGEVVGQIWQFPPALTEAIKLIGSLATALAALVLFALEKKLWTIIKSITGVGKAFTLLQAGGLALVIYGVATLITQWDELSAGARVLMIAITALGTAISTYTALAKLADIINKQKKMSLSLLALEFHKVRIAASMAATAGIALFTANLMLTIGAWDKMSGLERVVSIFGLIGAAALAAAAGVAAFHNAWTVGTASIAIIGGLVAIAGAIAAYSAQMRDIEAHANGGLATKGSLFIAGEAGPELVTRTSGGGSTIMNMQQLEDAVARGMLRSNMATQGNKNQKISVNVGSKTLFEIFVDEARSNGYELVKVR